MFDPFDHQCMARALQLAEKGMETTDPNPRVGCVLTRNNRIVGEGWHRKCGDKHAEVYALEAAGTDARGATAYVSLEPCSHHGRTPACAPQLIDAGISRVVSAIRDHNPTVNGGGFSMLEAAGVRVEQGLMEQQAAELNAGFIKRMSENRPWVRVKLAQSLDGGTALSNGESQWISSAESREDVQKWRARSSAIMCGIGTLLADDPSLNVRRGNDCRQPLRIIVDSQWRTPATSKTLSLEGRVLIAGREDLSIPAPLRESPAELLPLPAASGRVDLHALMTALAEREVNELQVESGATLSGALMAGQLVDEVLMYQAPLLLGSGAREPFAFGPLSDMDNRIEMQWVESVHIGTDLRLRLKPIYRKL